MKKVIERFNAHVLEEQRKANGGLAPPSPAAPKTPKEPSKKGWLGGALRKVTGGSATPTDKAPETSGTPGAEYVDDSVEGMRVDFYLVVFLKFIASIVPTIEVDSTAAF